MISTVTTRKLTVALRLKRATFALCCLLIAIANLPKPVANQQQQWPLPQPMLGDRDHYQLIGDGDEEATAALAQQAASSSFSLADPSDAALAELLNSYGGGGSAHQLTDVQQQQTRGGGTPGHYEFEVAPKMEPPSAPRPPFKQATSSCPGSDLFGGFSPKHTLCGDLYQGKVPLNPMGQFVNDQAYPFELIKNKTLQFLARSLPILKTEYETIPKVARYLPAHQMLNPTAHASPLGHEHFQALNERAGYTSAPPAPFMQQQQRRRRRRRSAQEISDRNQHQASITVAELMPNATLVVSSAHSAASSSSGRIGGMGLSHHHSARSAPETSGHFAMITKDGYRPFSAAARVRDATTVQHHHDHAEEPASPQQRPPQTTSGQQQSPVPQLANTKDNVQQQHSRSHAAAQISSGGQQTAAPPPQAGSANVGRGAGDDGGQTNLPAAKVAAASTTNSRHASQNAPAETLDRQTQDVVQARSASGGGQQDSSMSVGSGQRASPGQARQQNNGPASSSASQQQQPQQNLKCANVNGLLMYSVCQAASALIEGDSAPAWLQAAKQIGNLVAATSSADSYSSSQASNPLWALWSAFSSSNGAADQSSNDLAYKSSGSGAQHQGKAVVSPISSVASVINLLNPLMSFFAPSLQRAGTADHHSPISIAAGPKTTRGGNLTNSNNQRNQLASGGGGLSSNLRTMSNLLLTGLSIAGLYDWLGTTPLFSPTATTFARRKKPLEAGETFVDTPASLAALAAAKQLTPGATSGNSKQPPTPCPSVEEYISPTFARNYQGQWKYVVQIPHEGYFTQTIQRSSCVRQKCEFTEGVCHEAPRWVSLLVAEIYYPNVVFNSPSQQTSQAGSTAGASQHSLDVLNQRVAMDNNVAATNAANTHLMNQLAMSMAPSNSHLQQVVAGSNQQHQAKSLAPNSQDPLQMTDSLNTYNHNLLNNAAFFNAANELGLDPTNVAQMQQLAQAHNFQLMQRNGLVPLPAHQTHSHSYSQQQQQQQQAPLPPVTAESRVSMSSNNNQATAAAAVPTQQRQQQLQQSQQQPVFNDDYIKALALETIRQNPHLSIDDLIKSLTMQQAAAAARRKKRDLSAQTNQHPSHSHLLSHTQTMLHHFNQSPVSQVPQQQQQQHLATRRSSGAQPAQFVAASAQTSGNGEQMMPAMNELSSTQAAHLAAAQQRDLAAGQLSGQSSMGQQQQQQQQQAAASMINNNQQQQHNMIRTPAAEAHDHLFKQQTSTTPANQMIASQSTLMNDIATTVSQQQHANDAATTAAGSGQQHSASAPDSQTECDGHDKIGCYVVRVYYDWFLVNGSCKCWKTNNPSQPGPSSNVGSGSSGSFIRRIFTG